jgi:hypothetical protein
LRSVRTANAPNRRILIRISSRARDYVKETKRIDKAFGDFQTKALSDTRSRSLFLGSSRIEG